MHLRRRLHRSRGFTLLELLIVVAITGLLAAIAVTGYTKYIHQAQSSEARTVIGQIRSGEEAIRAETLSYLSCSTTMTDYYPNTTPDDSRWVWERSADSRYKNCWAMLGVHPDAPVRYGYAVMANVAPTSLPPLDGDFAKPPTWPNNWTDGTPWFVVGARNQHISSVSPSLMVATSYDGTTYSEGDDN
jgi:prepilin-type N-terminal cleavage/methylation domain-containing protein